jgi:signal transduction histidine kinase
VDDLHDLTLLEGKQFSLNLGNINPIDLVEDIAGIYQPIFDDQGIKLELDLPKALSIFKGDSARIAQCLNNMLSNALVHTNQGGKVIISVSEDDRSIRFVVRDSGTGIAAEHLPYVFDRFYRVDPDRNRRTGGSGLGLAITKALVEAHGGEVTAFSQGKDRGSEFSMTFPR